MSTTSVFMIASCIIAGAIAIYLTSYNVSLLFTVVRTKSNSRFNATNISLLFLTIASIALLFWRILTVLIVTSPELNDLFIVTTPTKIHQYLIAEKVATLACVLFTTLGALNISFTWIELETKSRKLIVRTENSVLTNKKYILGAEAIFLCMMLVAALVGQMSFALFCVSGFLVFIIVVFIIAKIRIKQLRILMEDRALIFANQDTTSTDDQSRASFKDRIKSGSFRSSTKRNRSQKQAAKQATNIYVKIFLKIERTCLLSIVAFVALLLLCMVYAVLDVSEWRNFCPPSSLCVLMVVYELLPMCLVGVIAVIQWFIYVVVKTHVQRMTTQDNDGSGRSLKDSKIKMDQSL